MPCKNGASELEQALQATKVCNASVAELQTILRRVMLLVGLRAVNLPAKEETNILIQFIYKKYAGLTIHEIQLAFEKAVAGELEIETANCYENFSCEYFGRIMSAYKKWAAQKFNENQLYVVKPQTTNLLPMQADWKPLCEAYYQDYLKGKLHLQIMPYQLYDEFVKCKMMAEDVYEDYVSISKAMIIANLKLEMPEVSEKEKHDIKDRIGKIENGELTFQVEQFAKKLAVEFLYKTAKEKGFKNLFVKDGNK